MTDLKFADFRLAGLAAAVSIALAGAYPLPVVAGASAPQQPGGANRVDLSNASADEIRTHILDACVIRQWGTSTSSKDSYAERCGCYARRVTQTLSDDELAAFRRSAVFSDTARPKAQAAQAACKL
ncbi:hypothetical protein ACUSIJ_00245 [Pseudochelatococcus sp. B33]